MQSIANEKDMHPAAYTNDKVTNSYIGVPFLPYETIPALFEQLTTEATTTVL